MKVRATISFCGAVTMAKGEVSECVDNDTLKDLLSCGYVEPVEEQKAVKKGESKRGNNTES